MSVSWPEREVSSHIPPCFKGREGGARGVPEELLMMNLLPLLKTMSYCFTVVGNHQNSLAAL